MFVDGQAGDHLEIFFRCQLGLLCEWGVEGLRMVDSIAHLHHAEMLRAVVRLEEGVACPALDEDTAERPQVDRMRPAWEKGQ